MFLLEPDGKGGIKLTPVNTDTEFMDGYRQGFPLVGEVLPPMPENPSAEYLRGLEAGRQDYVPGLPYE